MCTVLFKHTRISVTISNGNKIFVTVKYLSIRNRLFWVRFSACSQSKLSAKNVCFGSGFGEKINLKYYFAIIFADYFLCDSSQGMDNHIDREPFLMLNDESLTGGHTGIRTRDLPHRGQAHVRNKQSCGSALV
jgi:hypothetical protein